ncbi:MAG: DUF4065 domain-containing protein [Alphaproteobacteria bacterium]|jgi:uncharacterized phage-associated protein|nr:DUF4065 domain-containing protein [Alphaproteobacteria bacterium]
MTDLNITVNHVANAFIKKFQEENIELTHMQLQKLVYYAYAAFLVIAGKPLFTNKDTNEKDSPFEAWAYGPVDRELYNSIKSCNNNAYKIQTFLKENNGLTEDTKKTVDDLVSNTFRVFKGWSAKRLSDLSHSRGGAWGIIKQSENEESLLYLQNEDIKKEADFLFFK